MFSYVFVLFLETLAEARKKANKALYISDLDDEQPLNKKNKVSIKCPIYLGNLIIMKSVINMYTHLIAGYHNIMLTNLDNNTYLFNILDNYF